MKPQQSELRNLIEFAFAQRKFKKVLEVALNYEAQFGQQKDIKLIKAKAHSELTMPQQCLRDLQSAMKLGASHRQVSTLRIRSLIENNQIKEAEKQMNRLMEQNKELKTTFQLYKAIALLKDDFQTHKLSQKQENILQGMKSWLYKSGAKYQKLKVVNLYPGYRGVIATKHIKKKQQIVYIPKSELITLEMARANQTSQIIIQKNVRLHSPKHTLLSILLLELKNTPNSKYQPYIDLLPEDHSCFPINYTKEELELLDGSPFLNMIYEKVIGLKKDYETVIKCDPNFKKYTFKQFCWARNMVGSRIFGLVVKGVKTEILVPFADMLNHRHPKQTIWSYQQSMNGFIIESEEDIEVGQQVFDSYGKKCNSRYLLSYGFTLEDNQDNEISIKIEIDEKDPLCRMKKEVIRENVNETYTQIRKINLNFHNNKFYQFMGALRFITIDEEETLNMLKKISNIQLTKQAYVMVRTPPISVKNQLKVWVKLLTLCQNSLSKYQGTLEQDRQLLKSKKLTQNERNIISLRMGQKHILKQFILASSQVIKILQSPNVIEALEQNKSKNYAKYLYKILSLTPGINKKNLDKRLSPHFSAFIEEKQLQDTEQIAES